MDTTTRTDVVLVLFPSGCELRDSASGQVVLAADGTPMRHGSYARLRQWAFAENYRIVGHSR